MLSAFFCWFKQVFINFKTRSCCLVSHINSGLVRYQPQNGQNIIVDTRTPSRLKAGAHYSFTIEG